MWDYLVLREPGSVNALRFLSLSQGYAAAALSYVNAGRAYDAGQLARRAATLANTYSSIIDNQRESENVH